MNKVNSLKKILSFLWKKKQDILIVFFVSIVLIPSTTMASIKLNDRESFQEAIKSGSAAFEGWGLHAGNNIMLGGNCFLAGGCGINCPDEQQVCYNDQGAIGTANNLISVLIGKPPVSNVEYFADVIDGLKIGKPAYAQSVGFQALSPILPLWKISRNICYVFFVIVFLIVGFMILFRTRINPQTVISVENSLPKIVVALILVTFSYSIVALFVDISELLIYFVAGIYINFTTMGGTPPNIIQYVKTIRDNNSIFTLMGSLNSTSALVTAINQTIAPLAGGLGNALRALGISTALGELILNIALISALFKTFFALISAYVNIILQAIFSPFIFLFGSVSTKSSFGEWIKDILSNILVFPATFGLLLLGAIILNNPGSAWNITGAAPPAGVDFDTNSWVPFGFGGIGATTVGALLKGIIAFGIILMVPSVPQMIKQAFERKPGIAEGAMEGLKGAAGNIPILGQFLR